LAAQWRALSECGGGVDRPFASSPEPPYIVAVGVVGVVDFVFDVDDVVVVDDDDVVVVCCCLLLLLLFVVGDGGA
jgi:hypothetical protein